MPNLHLRDVDETLVRKLHQRARANGRSAAEEHRKILREALLGGSHEDIHALAAQLRELTRGRRHTPSEALLRESRDER
jgi:antitoxin FitA